MRVNIKVLILCILFIAVNIPIPGAFASSYIGVTAYAFSPDTDSKVRLDWTDVPGAETYEIYREGVLVETIDTAAVPDPLTYIDTNSGLGLQPKTTYTYTIKAIASDSAVLAAGEAVAETTDIIKPYNLKAVYNINSRKVILTWKSSLHATGSVIGRTANGVRTEIETSSTTGEEILETGTTPIYYTIKSVFDEETSPESDPVAIGPIDMLSLTASKHKDGISVGWSSYVYISNFQLERSKWNDTLNTWGNWEVARNTLQGLSTVDILSEVGLYRYRLAAKSSSPYIGYSNIPPAVKYLTAPSELEIAISGSSSISLEWENNASWLNSSEAGLGIEVGRQVDNGPIEIISGPGLLPKDTDSFTDTFALTSGGVYTYRVWYADAEQNRSADAVASINAETPTAPSLLRANVLTAGVVELSWQDNSSNESEFIIEKRTDSGIYEEAGTAGKNVTTYTDSSVTAGHSYIYRVRARNPLGISAPTNEIVIASLDTVPPMDLRLTPVSSSRIDLAWSYTGTTEYKTVIERRTGGSNEWRTIAITSPGSLRYSDTGLSANTLYYYRIRKYLGEGVSGVSYPNNSVGIEASTLISGLSLTGNAFSGNTIYLSWSGNSSQADVVIERKMSNGSFSVLDTVSGTTTGWYDNTGLIPGASYTYRIKAKTSSNESLYSNEVTVVNLFLDPPTYLMATADAETGIELSWYDNSTSETGFEIWRSTYSSSNYVLIDTVGANETSYTDTDVSRGVQYYYRVRSFIANENIYSSYSNTASTGIGLIKPPEDLTYTYVSETTVTLNWKDTSDNETGFKVERRIGENGEWSIVSWLSANTTSYTMSDLNKGVKYYVRIRAFRYYDNADSLSNEILVSTSLPVAPADVTATAISSSKIKIEWEDISDSEEGFRILRRMDLGYYYLPVAEVSKDTTSYIDGNLNPGNTYYYMVEAFNPAGASQSPIVSAQTGSRVTFYDLDTVPWARDAIETLASSGIIKGISSTLFNPMGDMTKAEFAALAVRAFGFDTSPIGTLEDVKPNKWYYREVMIAENFGLIEPDRSNRFYPEKPITREEVCVLLVNALRESGQQFPVHDNSVLEKYSDRNLVSPNALASVAALVGEGILEGTSSTSISPKNTLTRAEAAVFIYRALNKYYELQG